MKKSFWQRIEGVNHLLHGARERPKATRRTLQGGPRRPWKWQQGIWRYPGGQVTWSFWVALWARWLAIRELQQSGNMCWLSLWTASQLLRGETDLSAWNILQGDVVMWTSKEGETHWVWEWTFKARPQTVQWIGCLWHVTKSQGQSTILKLLVRSTRGDAGWDREWRQMNPVLIHCNMSFRGPLGWSCNKLRLDFRKQYKHGTGGSSCNISS